VRARLLLCVFLGLCTACSAFVAGGRAVQPARRVAAAAAAPQMLDVASVDSTSQLLAASLSVPIPAYSPAKAFVMIAANIFVICTMSIQGKSLISGTSHDEMVESFGITWLLSGTSLGHIVGAGAILGLSGTGIL